MRLTLRTLLAWMDGVLPPEDQRQLGDKVEGSPVARKLVERIGVCVGNPQLSAPRIDGKGLAIDPDSVAEYLDNTLAPDRLEAFETICLESDLHLAEVAACHAILAEVAKHPEVLPPLDASHRRRLLEAMQHRVAAHPEMVTGERVDGRGAAAQRPAAARPPAPLPPAHERHLSPAAKLPVGVAEPAAGKRTPWGAWVLAGSALALLAVLAALLAQSAGLFRSPALPKADLARIDARPPIEPGPAPEIEGGAQADSEAEPAVDLRPLDGEPGADEAGGSAADNGRPRRGLADLLEQADADEQAGDLGTLAPDDALAAAASPDLPDDTTLDGPAGAAVDGLEGAPAEGAPLPPAEIAAAAPRKVRAGEALAIAGGVRPRRPPAKAAGAGGAADAGTLEAVAGAVGLEGEGAAAESLGFVAADGLLLRRAFEGERSWWVPIGVGTPLLPGEELIVPPGMHPELNVAGVSLRVLPRSRLTLTADADGTPRIGIVEGRIVARAAKADARLGILAGGIAGTVVGGLDGAVMAETALAWSPGLGETSVPTIAEVIAVGRAVRFVADNDAAPVNLPARGGLRWESTGPDGVALLPSGRVPPWALGGEKIEPLERNAQEAFAAKLAALPAGSDPAAGLQEVILAMAIDRRVENRVFAAILLALEGSYDVAVELLCAEEPARRLEGRQWAALEAATIPLALSRGPESAARLRKAWEDRGPAGRVELLLAMARGPDDADLNAGADATLVGALAAKELVVRRYALKALVDVVEPSVFDRARFRPEAPDDARRDGVAWWRSLQEKGGIRRNR